MHDMQPDFAYLRSPVLSRAYPFSVLTISDHFKMARQENGADVSECLHNITSVTSRVTLRFALLATGPNFGRSDFIGLSRGQSEMTVNGMSSYPHNRVNSLDLILMRLGADNPRGQYFDVNRNLLSLRSFATSFKKIFLKSDFIHFFSWFYTCI